MWRGCAVVTTFRRFAVVGLLCGLFTGCSRSEEQAEAHLKQVKDEGLALTSAVADLEGRLLADQANVHLWQELAKRHQHVSAIAVANHSEHVAAMTRLIEFHHAKANRLEMAYSKRIVPSRIKGHD